MLRLNLFQSVKEEERIDIYYSEMTLKLQKVISVIKNEKPVIYGMKEEEKTLLNVDTIFYIETVDRRTFAYTATEVYQITKNLSAIEEELKAFGFIRINKSNIINIYAIQKIKPEPNMRISAILKNGEKLQINRGYKRSFEEYLEIIRKTV